MPLRRPSKADLAAISSKRHLRLTEAELEDLHELVCDNLDLYDELEQYPDPVREIVPAVRVPGRAPWRCGGWRSGPRSAPG